MTVKPGARIDRPQLQLNDKDVDNPDVVDELLSKELMQLSVNDRNEILEEIHGVGCLAPTETPEMTKNALSELERELENEVPEDRKRAYEMSQQFKKTYVNEMDFRMRFLRCELFDTHKAALRICEFLDLVLQLFGEFALRRPIMLDDFSKEELREFRKGLYQFLPFRDRAGRRIVTIIPGKEMEKIKPETKAKIALYTSWAAGTNDVDTQRKGIVFLVWFDKNIETSQSPSQQRAKDHEVASVRACAIHCCTPDTPLYRFRRCVMTMRIASHNRSKLNVHLGEAVENRYALQTYGIPAEQVPVTWSGTIKLQYHKQWMRLRQAIEKRELEQSLSGLSPSVFAELNRNTMIECPNLNDVLFRQGTSTTSHSGNVAFRLMIETRLRELELIQQREAAQKQNLIGSSNSKAKTKKKITNVKTRKVCMDIIEEIQQKLNGRFLFWNESGWWDQSKNEEQIYLKVEYIVREYRQNLKRKRKAFATAEKDEEERALARARARTKSESPCSKSDQENSKKDSYNDKRTEPTKINSNAMVLLKSETSIFLENQQTGIMSCFSGTKRPRVNAFVSDDEDNSISPSEGTSIAAECFGMKFIEC